MGIYSSRISKHGKYQLSTPSINKPVFLSSDSQTLYSIKLTITCASSIIEK